MRRVMGFPFLSVLFGKPWAIGRNLQLQGCQFGGVGCHTAPTRLA